MIGFFFFEQMMRNLQQWRPKWKVKFCRMVIVFQVKANKLARKISTQQLPRRQRKPMQSVNIIFLPLLKVLISYFDGETQVSFDTRTVHLPSSSLLSCYPQAHCKATTHKLTVRLLPTSSRQGYSKLVNFSECLAICFFCHR